MYQMRLKPCRVQLWLQRQRVELLPQHPLLPYKQPPLPLLRLSFLQEDMLKQLLSRLWQHQRLRLRNHMRLRLHHVRVSRHQCLPRHLIALQEISFISQSRENLLLCFSWLLRVELSHLPPQLQLLYLRRLNSWLTLLNLSHPFRLFLKRK